MSADVLKAAQDVVRVRNALDARRKANRDDPEPGVHWEVDAAIDYLADCLADVEREDRDTDIDELRTWAPEDDREASAR